VLVIASEAKQSSVASADGVELAALDCFVAALLAMTGRRWYGKVHCVYILTNQRNTVLYTGVTGDLRARVHQHREKLLPGFTGRYNVSKLVWYEAGYDPAGAIAREKQIKAGSRQEEDRSYQSNQSRMARSLRQPITRIEIASSLHFPQ